MKIRILGLTCLASLTVGCQSATSKALSRWNASEPETAQLASATAPGLPTPSQRKAEQAAAPRGNPEEHYAAGEALLRDYYRKPAPETLEEARRKFEAAVAADPGFAPAQHRLGIVADLQERYGQSESFYLTAMSLDPGNANIPADLGYSYQLQERWMAAERYLAQALQIDPKHTKAAEHLAEVHFHEGKTLLAEQTLMRAMPREQAQARLATMTASQPASARQERAPVGVDSSAQQKLLAEFQRAGAEGAAARAQAQQRLAAQGQPAPQMPNTPPGNPWAAQNNQPRPDQIQGQLLRDQLAHVDQTGLHDPQSAIVIGGREIQPAANSAPLAQGSAVNPAVASNIDQQLPVVSPGRMDRSAAPNSGVYGINPASSAMAPAQIYAGNRAMNPLRNRQDLSGGGQLTGDSDLASMAPQAPSMADPLSAGQSIPTAGLAGRSQAPNWQGESTSGVGASGPATNSSFDDARRAAALMGLGVGPGQLFSSLEHQTNRLSPGSRNRMNGPYYGETQVEYPENAPLPDLRQSQTSFPGQPVSSPPSGSFSQQPAAREYPPAQSQSFVQRSAPAGSMAPPPNSMGQHMPASSPAMTTPANWGDPYAGATDAVPAQASGMNAPPLATDAYAATWPDPSSQQSLNAYDATRRQVNQTLDQTVNAAWANSPAQAIPSPSSGVAYQQPAPPAQQMESWNRQPIAPEPYHNAPQQYQSQPPANAPLPAVSPVSGQFSSQTPTRYAPMTTRSVTPTYRDGVVVPEQYRSSR